MTVRIAYYLPRLEASGERTLVRSIQRQLPADRYQTRLFGFVRDRSLQGDAGEDECRLSRSLSIDPFSLLQLAREIRAWQPDLLHAWGIAELGIESCWPLSRTARWRVGTVHNPAAGKGRMIPPRGSRWLKHCHRVTATSSIVGRQLEDLQPGMSLEVIPAAVEPYDGSNPGEQPGIPPSATVIAVAGFDARHEGVREALEMMELLCSVKDNLHMVLLGRAATEPWIRRFSQQLEIDSRVHLPTSGCWQQVLQEATLLLMPARSHGVSTTLLHAMAASVPVVLADTVANRSLVDESCVDFFPAGDSGQCARQVHQLLKDPARLALMAESGLKFHQSADSVCQMVEHYDAVYQEIVEAGR
jgi:glycosyltransferase involved in cell wall biosynthesis